MRKFFVLAISAGLLLGIVFSSPAAVQHVRIGGELRTRAFLGRYLRDLGVDDFGEDGVQEFFIRQRSRLTTEVDLTDMVMGVATIEAEGVWGRAVGQDEAEWDVNLAEAYIQLSEIFYSPVTLKVGRQYLHYGRGFLISSREFEYNFDAVRTVFDFYPWTVDLIYSRLDETNFFAYDPTEDRVTTGSRKAFDDRDLFGVNLNYSSDFWTMEGYVFGIRDAAAEEFNRAKDAPVTVGVRGDASPVQALDIWGEVSYQLGRYEPLFQVVDDEGFVVDVRGESQKIRALAFDVGAVYIFDTAWEPALAFSYVFASGDKEDSDKREGFNPLWNYNYYGYAYSPRLSNIGIANVQLSFIPSPATLLILDFFYYQQDRAIAMRMGDWRQDNGGVMAMTNGIDKNLGMELDVIFEYNYSEDLSARLIGAWFTPGDAYETALNPDPKDAVEGRIELRLTF